MTALFSNWMTLYYFIVHIAATRNDFRMMDLEDALNAAPIMVVICFKPIRNALKHSGPIFQVESLLSNPGLRLICVWGGGLQCTHGQTVTLMSVLGHQEVISCEDKGVILIGA